MIKISAYSSRIKIDFVIAPTLGVPVMQSTLLVWIELLRLDLGRPMREPRHPDITMLEQTNTPWPLANS